MSEVYIAATVSDGSVYHVAVQTDMRCATCPQGGWTGKGDGTWVRDASDENIVFELWRFEEQWQATDGVSLVSWRRLSLAEHELFNKDRHHRNALEDKNGKIQHNMPKARELHRDLLRHQRGERLVQLDGQWMRATGQGKKADADAIEVKRQALRDLPADPRIDAARTLEKLKAVQVPE